MFCTVEAGLWHTGGLASFTDNIPGGYPVALGIKSPSYWCGTYKRAKIPRPLLGAKCDSDVKFLETEFQEGPGKKIRVFNFTN